MVLGLGNPILRDDVVGLKVAEQLKSRVNGDGVTVMEATLSALDLLDIMPGFEKVIIIDAIQTGEGKVGQVFRLSPDALADTKQVNAPHHINFATALELGKKLSIPLPKEIVIFAIEAEDLTTISEGCTPDVERAIPVATEMIIQELQGVIAQK